MLFVVLSILPRRVDGVKDFDRVERRGKKNEIKLE
jgi:hypothetical protein